MVDSDREVDLELIRGECSCSILIVIGIWLASPKEISRGEISSESGVVGRLSPRNDQLQDGGRGLRRRPRSPLGETLRYSVALFLSREGRPGPSPLSWCAGEGVVVSAA